MRGCSCTGENLVEFVGQHALIAMILGDLGQKIGMPRGSDIFTQRVGQIMQSVAIAIPVHGRFLHGSSFSIRRRIFFRLLSYSV